MSSNADTIKDFLVSLGFDIDQAGASKFEAVLKGVTANVMKVGAAVEGAALSIVGFTTRIANGLDKIYWASQRTGASVQGIKALGYAASQTGASAESAMSSLESLSRFVRNNPGAEGFLNRLGVQTRDASGNMRDMAAIFTGVGQKLSSMPYYRANQYAQMLGIDENTLMAMRRGMNGFTADYQSMLQKTGFNADKAAVQSNKFMTSMRGLTSLFGIMRDKIGSNLAGGLAGSLDSLRKRILDNFPKIEETLTKVIKGVIWLANAFTRMAWRLMQGAGSVIDWWKRLDDGSKNLLKIFGALLVAWRLLNAAFLKSPIGLITTLILAIGLLYDDYQTWKEGGNSLIDWEKWQPAIDKAKDAMVWLRDHLLELKDSVGGWQKSLEILGTFIAGVWVSKVLGAFGKISGLPIPPWLKLWGLYAGYIVSDRENIADSAKSSLSYTKRIIGDTLAAIGIKTDIGRRDVSEVREWPAWMDWLHGGPGKVIRQGQSNGVVYGSNIQPDIPGGGTLADRNNNPGNIRPVGGNGFRFFESAIQGWEAMKNQLMRYFTGKTTGRALQTIQDIVSTWAPAGDNNDPKKYAQDVAKWMGVSPNAVLNLTDPRTMGALMQSMARKEGYSNWNSPLAYQAAGGSLNQQTVINVHGVNNPQEAANLIADKQGAVNARAVQQLKGPA
ncbi:lytic transglycosylase catalytic [Salmonella enterica subsp. enterica serovar Eastbourne]|uniref:Lytic transglycosylase catalytic n=1 Tax=Salmonella enterica subsp. enterica serovar Eastbourne TaxID=486993 RepID=A0A702B6R2_SALET|nr:lytic transglycosylase catalytic [Salmonella enterica subsp. enterica serovar Eastbourne]ECA1895474.1 lytic transglycosylase catalytic [Salmonella enterica subsp. enterica serovar Eastbourne]HAC6675824.1 lytic transglycosylase catalytic [Salmonella enterica subsp. enterica serovar Eastbourne]HAE5114883.1 lytic transglycosylase catalytic [Salmonella enterica subsp. enterica serovar Eastbourne]HAE8029203.1 lytic transglycosylase catalytic [Salmonella enterica subsp. enterica serovar Eastbourne